MSFLLASGHDEERRLFALRALRVLCVLPPGQKKAGAQNQKSPDAKITGS